MPCVSIKNGPRQTSGSMATDGSPPQAVPPSASWPMSFSARQDERLAAKEIAPRTFKSLLKTCEMLVGFFGRHKRVITLTADDFADLRAEHLPPAELAHRLGE